MEHEFFHKIDQLGAIVCRQCQHAVWPREVEQHLTGRNHRLPRADARSVWEAIQQWGGLKNEPSQLRLPDAVDDPIPVLEVHPDGLLCTREAPHCRYITRSLDVMKRHWRERHQWTIPRGNGRVRTTAITEAIQAGFHMVACQQLFPSRYGSQYIHVRHPPVPTATEATRIIRSEAACRLVTQAKDQYRQAAENPPEIIQPGELDEANPWLRRTEWSNYLRGLDHAQLLASIDEPDEENDDPTEVRARAIWQAMDGLIRHSQMVVSRTGHQLRLEAIRTERHQNQHRPLQPYMDADTIVKHMRPWQQVMMFFARTQVDHDWESPGYGFTPRQRKTWRVLWQLAGSASTSTPDERSSPNHGEGEAVAEDTVPPLNLIQVACLEVCIELLNQSTRVHEYESALVCALSVLGVRKNGWRDTEDYPQILSRMIKIARFMVVVKAIRLDPNGYDCHGPLGNRRRHDDLQWDGPMTTEEYVFESSQDSGYESEGDGRSPVPSIIQSSIPTSTLASSDSERPAIGTGQLHGTRPRSFREWLALFVDAFMVRGTHSPMQWMLDLRTYGLKIYYNQTSSGHVGWRGPDELLYKQIHFTMGDFRGFIHGLVGDARRLLREELLFGDRPGMQSIPTIPWLSMCDDPTESRAGWSFLKDQRTRWPVNGEEWLIDRISREPWMQQRFIRAGPTPTWNRRAIRTYFQQMVRFREKLSVLVHITAGQPARAPELLSIRFHNTPNGGHRNIFIEDGMVVFVTHYHKGFHVSNDIKIIHRYVPQEVGELVVWYLWLVRPFVQQLEGSQPPPAPRESSRRTECLWGPDPNGQAWSSERFRDVLKRETAVGLKGQSLNIASYRDIAIGISRRFMRASTMFPNNVQGQGRSNTTGDDDHGSSEDPDEWLDTIADFQAGHTPHTAGLVYGRDIMERPGAVHSRRQQFRVSSTDWHRFLGFETAYHGDGIMGMRKRQRAPFDIDAEEALHERRFGLMEANMGEALQRMMGDTQIVFRGVQEPAIRAIQTGESPVVAVMPTGGGKSMLFMLPAWVEPGGLTVVVVPLISLRQDLRRRCIAYGVTCVEWESRRPPDEASIVLVTPESALSDNFTTFLNRQRILRRLDRIVIDECHVILNNQADFRPQMQRLGQLVHTRTQIVMLTATLPPSEEGTLFERMHFQASSVQMFRARTNRPNVAYRIIHPAIDWGTAQDPHRWVEAPEIVAWIRQRIQRHQPGKTIIYAPTVVQVKLIATALGCEGYYHDAPDKEAIFDRFRQGQTSTIAATSALGMGIDINNIRGIMHLGRPRTLLDYGQESGRGGRDGQHSEAVMIIPTPEPPAPWHPDGAPSIIDQALVQRYIDASPGVCGPGQPPCRRVELERYLDGVIDGYVRHGCEDGEIQCDGCDPDWEAQEPMITSSSTPSPGSSANVAWEGSMSNEPIPGRPGPSTGPSPNEALAESMSDNPISASPSASDPIQPNEEGRRPGRRVHSESISDSSGTSSMIREEQRMRRLYPDEFESDSPGRDPRTRDRVDSPGCSANVVWEETVQSHGRRSTVVPHSIGRRFREQDSQRDQLVMQVGQQQQRMWVDSEFLERELAQWCGRCWICHGQGRDEWHMLKDCANSQSAVAQQWAQRVQKQVKYDKFAGCWNCGIPQSICQHWVSNGLGGWVKDSNQTCQFPKGLIISMVAGMLHGPNSEVIQAGWMQWLRQYQVDGRDLDQVIRFFGRRATSGAMEQNYLVLGFCWLRRAHCDVSVGAMA